MDILLYCQKYGFRYEYLNSQTVKVFSKYDEWVIYDHGYGKYRYTLYHMSSLLCGNNFIHHKQRDFMDLDFLFASIARHDKWKERRIVLNGKKRRSVVC